MQKVFQLKSSRQRRRRGQAVRCWGVSEQAHDMPRIAVTTTKEITIQLQKQVELTRSLFFHFVLLFVFAIAFFPLSCRKVNSRHAGSDSTLKPVATNSNRQRATPQSPTILTPFLSQAMCIRDELRELQL